jgi:hypothetical protein
VIGWAQFLKVVLLGLGGLLAFVYGFIVLINPYGHLPWRVLGAHVIMDTNQRFQYPAIARSQLFNSVVIGTSSARLLDPDRLDAALGGRFANLSMNAARAWEQYRLARLFLAHQPRLKTLLMALDWVWCDQRADVDRITVRGFPEWLYDENPWNDWIYLLNPPTIEFAGRLALYRLGLKPARLAANGFSVFVPPESAYDAVKAENYLWQGRSREIKAVIPAYAPSNEDLQSWKFPAIAWLDELLADTPTDTRRIIAFMPAHISGLPVPGSRAAAREQTCKERIWEVGNRRGAELIDFRIYSSITTRDANFWDPQHYRLPIAHRIVDGIARAVATRLDDPGGDWTYVH